MNKSIGSLLSVLIITLACYGCTIERSYESMVQRGLQSGIQKDSLFLGYYFGMPSDEFLESSWEMNQQGIMTGYTQIEYTLQELKSRAHMSFYPEFIDGKIARMPITIGYSAWAPWNQQYWPEELIKDLIDYYGDIYDAEFINVYVPEIEAYAYVSITGNREIRIRRQTDSTVQVDFIDLNRINPL